MCVCVRTQSAMSNSFQPSGLWPAKSWDNERKKWKAIIHFKKKRYYLGRYDKKEDAIKARQEAEERFFKPIIDEYKYL